MSTRRNYSWQENRTFYSKGPNKGFKPKSFNQIDKIVEYIKKPLEPEYVWNPRFERTDKDLMISTEIRVLTDEIPREIKWKIEEDYMEGAKELARYFGKQVTVRINGKEDSVLPKMCVERFQNSGAGAFERKSYYRSAPDDKAVYPTHDLPEISPSKILLVVFPNKDHYIHTAQQSTKVVHDYCECCQHSDNGVGNTLGTGKKSSKKTKGRHSRRKAELFYSNKGDDSMF